MSSSLQFIALNWPLWMSNYFLQGIRKLLELAFILSSLDMVTIHSSAVLFFSINVWLSMRKIGLSYPITAFLTWYTELMIFVSAFLSGEISRAAVLCWYHSFMFLLLFILLRPSVS